MKNMQKTQINYIQRITLLGVGLTTLSFWLPAIDVFNFPKQAVLVGFIFPIAAFTIFWKKKRWTRIQIISFGLLFLLMGQVILSAAKWGLNKPEIFWGVFSRANGTVTMVAFILLAIIAFQVSNEEFLVKISKLAQVILTLEIIYGIMQFIGKDPVDWINPYSPIILTVGNPNFAASLLSVLSILNLGNITPPYRFSLNNFATSSLSLIGVFLSYLTSSIQGVVGIGAAIIIFLTLATLKFFKKLATKFVVLGTLLVISSPVLAGLLNYGPLADRIYQYTLAVRAQYWQVGLEIMKSYPVFGVGPDQYGDYFLRYRKPEFVEQYGFFLFTNNAHNSVIQWGSTVGVLASLILIVLFCLTILRITNALLASEKLNFKLTIIFVAWFIYTLQSLISIEQIGIAIWGWLLLGTLLGYSADYQESSSAQPKAKKSSIMRQSDELSLLQIALIPLIVFAMVPATSFVMSDVKLKQSFQIPGGPVDSPEGVNRGNLVLQRADKFLGMRDYTNLVIKNFLAAGPIPFAQRAAEIATQKNPDNSETWNWLSETRARSGDIAGSVEAIKISITLDPLNDSSKMVLAKRYLELGNIVESQELAKTLINSPDPTITIAAKELLGMEN